MKLHKILFFPLAVISILLISSCSDDNTTTNPPTSDVLLSLDSLSVWLSGSGNGNNSYTLEQTTTINRVKVEYTIQTNVDSTGSMAWVRDSSNGTPSHIVEQQYYWSVDSLVSYVMDIPSQPVHLKLAVRLNKYGGAGSYYIRLKNIKVTKQ